MDYSIHYCVFSLCFIVFSRFCHLHLQQVLFNGVCHVVLEWANQTMTLRTIHVFYNHNRLMVATSKLTAQPVLISITTI